MLNVHRLLFIMPLAQKGKALSCKAFAVLPQNHGFTHDSDNKKFSRDLALVYTIHTLRRIVTKTEALRNSSF